jgi:hypothetical protein
MGVARDVVVAVVASLVVAIAKISEARISRRLAQG